MIIDSQLVNAAIHKAYQINYIIEDIELSRFLHFGGFVNAVKCTKKKKNHEINQALEREFCICSNVKIKVPFLGKNNLGKRYKYKSYFFELFFFLYLELEISFFSYCLFFQFQE